MTLDNSKHIISLRIKLFGATVVFLAYIILTYAAEIIKFPLFGMSDTLVTTILSAIYVIIVFIPMLLNYQFVYFTDDEEKIVFRYFNAGIVGGRKNSVEIHKQTFTTYKTEKKFFGLKTSIILYQRFNEGVAKYPPVYISAVPEKERQKIFSRLNLYVQQM